MHTWEFQLKGNYHKIEFWDSRLSGKKKLAVDGKVIVENNNSIAVFNYSFQLDSYYFNLVQVSDTKYDIKINSFFFDELKKAEISGQLNRPKKEDNNEQQNETQLDNSNYQNQSMAGENERSGLID